MEKSENKVNVNLIYLLKLIKAVVSDALIIWWYILYFLTSREKKFMNINKSWLTFCMYFYICFN